MAITLQLQTTNLPPTATNVNVYRRRANVTTRIVQLPINQSQYTDATGIANDIYWATFFDAVRFSESGPSPLITAMDNLQAVTITGFVQGIDGNPAGYEIDTNGNIEGVDVVVTLQNLSNSTPISDGSLIASIQQTVTTDDTGTFVLTLVPNDLIFPGQTFYKFEYIDKRWFKTVKSTDGQAQLFVNLLDVNPYELR